jgi:hypothetical protein
MKEWFSQYGYLVAVFFVVLVVFIIVLNKAAKAYSSHFNTVNEQKKQLEYLTNLKNKYRSITAEELEGCSDGEILEGFALLTQVEMQKSDDMEAYFRSLPEIKKYIYVLDVFTQDEGAEIFFSQNGEILTDIIVDAIRAISMTEFADELSSVAKMYNKDDESVSFDKTRIENFDKTLNEKCIINDIKANSAKYIKENFNLL